MVAQSGKTFLRMPPYSPYPGRRQRTYLPMSHSGGCCFMLGATGLVCVAGFPELEEGKRDYVGAIMADDEDFA